METYKEFLSRIDSFEKSEIDLGDKYREKETEFLSRLFDGVTDEQIRSTYCFLSKLEDNLKLIYEENRK